MKLSEIKQRICWVILSMIVTGCTLIDGHVNLSYQPEAESKSPLSTISSLLLRVEVYDQRPTIEKYIVGYKKGGFGNVLASVKTNQDIPSVLRQALEAELRSNGHAILTKSAATADVTLAVQLKRYWTEPTVRFFDVQVLGTLNANVEILDTKDQLISSRLISGTSVESWQLAVDEAYESVLNGALREFVRNLARDSTIIKVLRSVPSK